MNYLKILLLLLLIYPRHNTLGQKSSAIDSLTKLTTNDKNKVQQIQALNELAWLYRKTKPEKAITFAKKALTLSNSLGNSKEVITSLNRLGVIAIYQKRFDEAEDIYQNILKKENSINNIYGAGRAHNQLGLIFTKKGLLQSAIPHYEKSKKLYLSLNHKKNVATILNNIGDLQIKLGDLDKATKALLESIAIRRSIEDLPGLAASNLNLGVLYIKLLQFKQALIYLQASEQYYLNNMDRFELAKTYNNLGVVYYKLNSYSKALFYYKKAEKFKTSFNALDASNYNNIGSIYYHQKEYDLALKAFKKSIQIQKIISDSLFNKSYSNIGNIYYQKRKYSTAIDWYKKSLTLAQKSSVKLDILLSLKNISDCYLQLNQFKNAIQYNNQYLTLRDEIDKSYRESVSYKASFEAEQKKYELSQKDKRIIAIDLEKEQLINSKKNLFIMLLAVGLLLSVILIFFIIRGARQEQLLAIAKKDREIESQKVEELLKKQELKSINAMITGQENERQRIARDLHDRLGSMLSMVKIHFKSVEDTINEIKTSTKVQYIKANKLLDDACEEVRNISQDIASGVLTNFGLIAALEDLKYTLEDSKQIEVEFVSHGFSNRLDFELEIAIYRIIQELISNVLKYAQATEVSIQLLKSKEKLNIIVEDNGIGFDFKKPSTGMGFKNISSRIDYYNGDMNIDSTIDKGTTITIDIPIKKH